MGSVRVIKFIGCNVEKFSMNSLYGSASTSNRGVPDNGAIFKQRTN
jgi:hypothetical protein